MQFSSIFGGNCQFRSGFDLFGGFWGFRIILEGPAGRAIFGPFLGSFWGRNRGGNRGGNRDGRGDFPGEIFRGGGEEFGRHRKRCRPHEGGRVLLKFRGGLLRDWRLDLLPFQCWLPLAKGTPCDDDRGWTHEGERSRKDFKKLQRWSLSSTFVSTMIDFLFKKMFL